MKKSDWMWLSVFSSRSQVQRALLPSRSLLHFASPYEPPADPRAHKPIVLPILSISIEVRPPNNA